MKGKSRKFARGAGNQQHESPKAMEMRSRDDDCDPQDSLRQDEVAPVYALLTGSRHAIVDAWACESNPDTRQKVKHLVFVSMSAPRHVLQELSPFIRRGTLFGCSIQLIAPINEELPVPGRIDASGLKECRIFQSRLPTDPGSPAMGHLIAVAQTAVTSGRRHEGSGKERYVYAKLEEEGPAAVYRHYQEMTRTPTIPAWRDEIWRMAKTLGMVSKLESSPGLHAWRCDFDDERLEPAIQHAVAMGQLPIE